MERRRSVVYPLRTGPTDRATGAPVDDPLRNKLLALLPRRDLNSVTEKSAAVEFAQGDVVQKEGRESRPFIPAIGLLSLLVVLKGGRMAETSVVGREGMVGVSTALIPRPP